MRIDLGLIQMELDGGPTASGPTAIESLLEYYEAKAQEALESGSSFSLRPEDCSLLMREGMQYYHRYLSAFHLERYDLVARDTDAQPPALRVRGPPRRPPARQDRVRPVSPVRSDDAHARQRVAWRFKEGEHRAALERIDEGIKAIRSFLRRVSTGRERSTNARSCGRSSAGAARSSANGRWGRSRSWSNSSSFPSSREDYEEAARIRDQIRRLAAMIRQ